MNNTFGSQTDSPTQPVNGENERLLDMMSSPMRLLSEGASMGVKGMGRLALIVSLFGAVNIVLLIYSLFSLFSDGFESRDLLYLLLLVGVAVGCTAWAGYKAYTYVIINGLAAIYRTQGPLFRRICSIVVDKAEPILKSGTAVGNESLQNMVNVADLLQEKYHRAPKLLQRGIRFLLNRIPFSGMLMEIRETIVSGDREKAADLLYVKADAFITENIFAANTTRFVVWLLPLNIAAIITILVLA